jgi:hypothetical protein
VFNVLTIITAGYPLVTDASTFWFGPWGQRVPNFWAQVEEATFSGDDSAMSFTWQNISVGSGLSLVKSFIARFGPFESSHLTLEIQVGVTTVAATESLSITAAASASRPATGPEITVLVQVDHDPALLYDVAGEFAIGVPFALAIAPQSVGVLTGIHSLTFFAVDADGDVSDGRSVTITIGSGGADAGGGDAHGAGGSRTVVAIIGAIAGGGFILGLFVLLLCYGRKRDIRAAALNNSTASGTDALKAYMADELLPG